MNENKNNITVEEFDRIFDEGKEDITPYLDMSSATRPNRKPQRVNVDFPAWIVKAIDKEAERIGISRQAFIKVTMAQKIESLSH